MVIPQVGQNSSNAAGANLNRLPGALGPDYVDYVFNHTGDYLFIIHIQGGASTSFLATVDVELEGETRKRRVSVIIHNARYLFRPERLPVRDRLPVVGVLRLHVRRLRRHGSRLARALLNALARSTSDSVLDRRSYLSRHVGEGDVLGNFV